MMNKQEILTRIEEQEEIKKENRCYSDEYHKAELTIKVLISVLEDDYEEDFDEDDCGDEDE